MGENVCRCSRHHCADCLRQGYAGTRALCTSVVGFVAYGAVLVAQSGVSAPGNVKGITGPVLLAEIESSSLFYFLMSTSCSAKGLNDWSVRLSLLWTWWA